MGKRSASGKFFEPPADPRKPDAATSVKMVRKETDESELVDPMATYMSLFSMVFGILAIVFKWKVMAFQSIICSVISFANTRTSDLDTKQILSGLSIAVMALVMCYRKEFTGQ